MPRLTPADVHVNKLLTNVGIRYKNTQYIADQCAPTVPVQKKTDYYASWGKSAWYRDEAGQISEGGRAPIVGLNVTLTNTYRCLTYGAAAAMPRDLMSNADAELQLEARYAELLTDKLSLAKERRVATLFQTTGNWTSGTALAGGTCWDAFATSTPVTDIDTGIQTVVDNTSGLPANTFITNRTTWKTLRRHPDILALVYGEGYGPKLVTPELFAKAFEFEKVLIGSSYYTADEEDTDDSGITYTGIWTDTTWIGYTTPAPSIITPSAAYLFREYYKVRTWYDDASDTDFMEVRESIDEVATAATCGYTITNCMA